MEKVRYLMTKKELVRVYVIKSLIEGKMTSRMLLRFKPQRTPDKTSKGRF